MSDKRLMEMNQTDYAIIINALMNMRNSLLKEQQETDIIDKVIRKTIKAPSKEKKEIFHKFKRKDAYETR